MCRVVILVIDKALNKLIEWIGRYVNFEYQNCRHPKFKNFGMNA